MRCIITLNACLTQYGYPSTFIFSPCELWDDWNIPGASREMGWLSRVKINSNFTLGDPHRLEADAPYSSSLIRVRRVSKNGEESARARIHRQARACDVPARRGWSGSGQFFECVGRGGDGALDFAVAVRG